MGLTVRGIITAMDIQELNRKVIEDFRANGGKLEGQFAGAPLLLLNTTGAKSGLPRTNPLAYVADGDQLAVVASYAGGPNNPPWFYNLVANPEVEVEIGHERFAATARIAEEPQRAELYGKMVAAMPVFSEYQAKTERVIPVIVLTRTPLPG